MSDCIGCGDAEKAYKQISLATGIKFIKFKDGNQLKIVSEGDFQKLFQYGQIKDIAKGEIL